LRDGNPERYGGKGVKKAVMNIQDRIRGALRGREVADQAALDGLMIELDGTPTRVNWAPTRSWRCRWPVPGRRRVRAVNRCTATSPASGGWRCRCR